MKQYKRKPNTVVAIQLPGPIQYEKWGSTQLGKKGDWLLSNDSEVYTVDQESFSRTYSSAGSCTYSKTGSVWAVLVDHSGQISTKEGFSAYQAGDMLVYNNPNTTDGYCMARDKFFSLYEMDQIKESVRSCNRHNNCDEANREWLEKNPGPQWSIPANFHCHDDDCEDCFGC